eukprot:13385-Heterococcus_DN1.PRE.3
MMLTYTHLTSRAFSFWGVLDSYRSERPVAVSPDATSVRALSLLLSVVFPPAVATAVASVVCCSIDSGSGSSSSISKS